MKELLSMQPSAKNRTSEHERKQDCTTWTAEVNEDGSSYTEMASELGNGLRRSDINNNNRWNRCLKK